MTRLAALTMLVTAMLVTALSVLLPAPAGAAPAGVEGGVSPRNLTLPAAGDPVEEILAPVLFADEEGWANSVTLTFDTSKVGVAAVEIDAAQAGGTCSAGPVVRCVLPGPHRVFERPDDDATWGFATTTVIMLTLTPEPGAAVGDAGTLSVATAVDGGAATTETATVRIGEGVDLTAVDGAPLTVAPGGAATLRPAVRNTGTTAVGGLTAVISSEPGALAGTNFGNCTYGWSIACTFDTTLTPGGTYRVSAPFTVEAPGDAAAGSETSLAVQWLTAAEWEDQRIPLPQDRTGTGPALELEEVAASAAGVPQADTDQDDNGTYTTVTVTGERRTDVVATGASIPGTPGEHTIEVGFGNSGPGTLRYPPFTNNASYTRVTLPTPLTVVRSDDRCRLLSDDETSREFTEFDCSLRTTTLPPDQQVKFTFTVRGAEAVHGEQGSVQVELFGDEDGIDRDPGNNEAAITVTAAGAELPITGTSAGATASIGLGLLFAGAAAVAVRRRRDGRLGA
ncbi:LPXTG cell wall anchor domain-containing protein [Actinoplanes sp. NPDC023714]|uniref:LPXTG cell wall anchor domain-containing protein n=1 Tax=Actinoplanes sp. NPDC023714 TaxID=3154322 RepID=UPI0034033F22